MNLNFSIKAKLTKTIMKTIWKSEEYIVSNEESNNSNSNTVFYDNPAYLTSNDIFTVSLKPDANSISSQTFKSDRNSISSETFKSGRRLSKRLSIISRLGDDSPGVNPLRHRMSFIKDTSGDGPLLRTAIQILLASLCAGFGNVGAGVILHFIQKWTVFIDIKEMFVLVPSLLGLKGNLEMTMASRLSTEANLGRMDKWSTTLRMIGGDMALVQCQATVVSFLAAIVAILVNVCQTGTFSIDNCLDICASSLVTANVACFLLGLVMAVVIVFSNKVNIDPDNIATPIAASLGDISTAALFALFAEWIHSNTLSKSTSVPIIATASITLFALLLPLFYIIARKNSFTHKLVHSGWAPIITAMIISSGGGLFLDSAVDRYDRLPPFQPVICGVGGNVVAVAASKISTRLHMNNKLGKLPIGISRFSTPIQAFYNESDVNTKLSSILMAMSIPLHLLYSIVIWSIQRERITITASLILLYISFASLQVFILLFICYNLVHILWSFAINPDNASIPILTSLGDLLGSAFLLFVFFILEKINDPNAIIISNSTITENYKALDLFTILSQNLTNSSLSI